MSKRFKKIFAILTILLLTLSTYSPNSQKAFAEGEVYNVTGKILNADGTAFTGGFGQIEVLNTTEHRTDYSLIEPDGSFYFDLVPGQYRIQRIDNGNYESLTLIPFTVSSDHTASNPLDLGSINIMEANVTGVVENMVTPTDSSYIVIDQIIKTAGSTSTWGYHVPLINKDGKWTFSIALPVDGNYKFGNVYDGENVISLNEPFQVNSEASESNTFTIDATPNVSGKILDRDGTSINGSIFVNKSDGDNLRIETNTDGVFKAKISDGEYHIDSAYDQLTHTNFNPFITFSVNNGIITSDALDANGELIVQQPVSNVSGVITNLPDSIKDYRITLISVPDDTTEARKSYNANVSKTETSTGTEYSFETYLPIGNYMVEGISGDEEFTLNTTFTVNSEEQDSVHINVDASVNLKGLFKDDVGNPVSNGNLLIEFRTSPNDWDRFSVQTNEDGKFSINLPDGEYEFVDSGLGMSHQFEHAPLSIPFKVEQGVVVSENIVDGLFTIQLNPPNVYGEITGADPSGESWLEIMSIPDSQGEQRDFYQVKLSSFEVEGQIINGFRVSLPIGKYQVSGIHGDVTIGLNKEFTVTSSERYAQKVDVSTETNIQGILQDANGNPVEYGNLSISNTIDNGESRYYSVQTDENGQFRAMLDDGSYIIQGASMGRTNDWKYERLNYEFTVVDGLVQSDLVTDNLLIIQPKQPNVSGVAYTDNKQTLDRGDIVFIKLDGNGYETEQIWVQTGAAGAYSTYLEPGQYIVREMMDQRGNWLSVKEVEVTVTGEPQMFNFEPVQNNITGTAFFKEGTPIIYGGLSVVKVSEENPTQREGYYWIRTNADGEFGYYLPEGTYIVDGISGQIDTTYKWKQIEQAFTITSDGKVLVDGQEVTSLDIVPPTPNIVGTVTAADGNAFEYGGISLRENKPWPNSDDYTGEIPSDAYPKTYWIQMDENGQYEFYLPESEYGYIIDGVSIENNWVDLTRYTQFLSEADLAESPYFVMPGTDTVTKDLNIPGNNIKGKLTNLTSERIYGINVRTKVTDENGTHYYGYHISVDQDGTFEGNLPEGTYEVEGLSIEDGTISLPAGLEIIVPNDNVTIEIPTVNVKGIAKNPDGTPLRHANIAVRPSDIGNEDPWENTFWINTDVNGSFQAAMDFSDGKTYTIVAISTEEGWSDLYQTIDAPTDSLIVQEPTKNVRGTVTVATGTVTRGSVEFVKLKDGEAVDHIWAEIKNGTYEVALPEGDYKISGIDTGEEWIPVNLPFSVTDVTTPIQENVNTTEMLNVNGKVTLNGTPLKQVWVGYTLASDLSDTSKIKWIQTNDNGAFELQLPDGDYVVTDINDPNGSGSWEVLNQPFTVTAGQTTDVTIDLP